MKINGLEIKPGADLRGANLRGAILRGSETIKYLRRQLIPMRKMAEIMRHIDYMYSGDHGEDSFMERVGEVEKHWEECEDLATRMEKWNETGDRV